MDDASLVGIYDEIRTVRPLLSAITKRGESKFSGRLGRVTRVLGLVVVVKLLLCLLSQEPLELRTKLVATGQLLVAPQQ